MTGIRPLQYVLVLLFCVVAITTTHAQEIKETAHFKAVQYGMGLSGIKTADKAKTIENDLKKLDGVTRCQLVFLEYHVDLIAKPGTVTPEDIKQVLNKHGVEITSFEQKIIR